MHPSPPPQRPGPPQPPVPEYQPRPRFDAVPDRAQWRYRPRRALWESRAVRVGALVLLLALCGLVILALVRQQTGTRGFVVGLGLAVLPVPLLVAAFCWLDRVEPEPWRNLAFAFAWGACAATLVAILANGLAVRWIVARGGVSSAGEADTWGAAVVAPVVEESAKAAALLLLFVFRRRHFNGIVDGVVIAGITATGFAFTENILFLGTAFGEDEALGTSGIGSVTAQTFIVRILLSPFAHPLFTALTGIGFGLVAQVTPRARAGRVLLPLSGLATAMGLHSVWNGSASLGGHGFIAVYALFMVPLFAVLTTVVIRSRAGELRAVREYLPAYVAAGWLAPAEPYALASMRARAIARRLARRAHGVPAARAVSEYQSFATALAFLRRRAHQGAAGADFAAREQELLHHLWQRKSLARPALLHAAAVTAPVAPPRWQPYGQGAYGQGAYGAGVPYQPGPWTGPQPGHQPNPPTGPWPQAQQPQQQQPGPYAPYGHGSYGPGSRGH
ncbi:PrsW family intramembrane metalloprotease [Streptomyces albus]|uniref:PrsW family intramembrane metalloprotease n=1 Tax=Streptomyces albus TaxID=1888 RepID=UPI00099DCA83|nr:PrsW family intramembrane metalloprotease [Streptomyces albus]